MILNLNDKQKKLLFPLIQEHKKSAEITKKNEECLNAAIAGILSTVEGIKEGPCSINLEEGYIEIKEN